MDLVADGIQFGESPRWHDGQIWFSDWGTGQVWRIADDGTPEVMAQVPSFPLCFDFLPDGRMLLVDSVGKRLLRREPDGELTTLTDLSHFSDYPWNDIVVDARGLAYVNNIGYDFPTGEPGPGLIVCVSPDGTTRQVTDDLAFPNGMAVSADGQTLVVAESHANKLTGFSRADDGGLGEAWLWAATGEDHPDGICIDDQGAVWYADVAQQHCVRVERGGMVLTTVKSDRGAFACALDRDTANPTLYVIGQDPRSAPGDRTGRLISFSAPAAGAGHP